MSKYDVNEKIDKRLDSDMSILMMAICETHTLAVRQPELEYEELDQALEKIEAKYKQQLKQLINKRVREAEICGVIAAENYHLELGDESIESASKRWSEILDRQNQLTSDKEKK